MANKVGHEALWESKFRPSPPLPHQDHKHHHYSLSSCSFFTTPLLSPLSSHSVLSSSSSAAAAAAAAASSWCRHAIALVDGSEKFAPPYPHIVYPFLSLPQPSQILHPLNVNPLLFNMREGNEGENN